MVCFITFYLMQADVINCIGHYVSVGSTNDFANVDYTIVIVLMYENQDLFGCFSFARFMEVSCQMSHHVTQV